MRNVEGAVTRGRTCTKANTTHKTFTLSAGDCHVILKAMKLNGGPARERAVAIEAGQTVEHILNFAE